MNEVWKNAPFEGAVLLILLSLADQANDSGECWPSMAYTASRARCSTRYARQVVKDLERDGWLERTLRPGQPTLYKVLTPEPQFTPSTSREEPQFTPELSSPLNPS